MKAILIDDEIIALELLELKLKEFAYVEIVGSYTCPFEALDDIGNKEVDVVFLDIEMGETNGVEISHRFLRLNKDIEIVFVTAYSEYAVDAFEINVIDYLLKPIKDDRLEKTINRLKEKIEPYEKNEKHNLRINSFGKFELFDKENNIVPWRTQKNKEVFVYLWMNDSKPISKDLIIEDIFPDRSYDKASSNLHTTIYQLRRTLKDLGYSNGIVYFNENYKLQLPVSSDLGKIYSLLNSNDISDSTIDEILDLYTGDLLEQEAYGWALDIQERCRIDILNTLLKYARLQFSMERYTDTFHLLMNKLIEIESYDEEIVGMMIRYLGERESKKSLIQFYENYTNLIKKELRIEPMDKLIELYEYYLNK